MLRLFILLFLSGTPAMIHSDKMDLQPPVLENGLASPGKRVAIVPAEYEGVPAEYEGTDVHHLLYLPQDWGADWKKTDVPGRS